MGIAFCDFVHGGSATVPPKCRQVMSLELNSNFSPLGIESIRENFLEMEWTINDR